MLLFSAQVVALIGTGLTTLALSLLAYDLAGGDAGLVLGTALAVKMLAYVGISPVVGAFAHRLPRKPLLVALDLLRAAIVFCFPFVDALWQIYLLIFLISACSAGFKTVFQAVIPEILPTEQEYTRALSLSRLAYDLENLLSPALAALALTLFSYHGLFAVNGVAFVISALLVISAVIPAGSFVIVNSVVYVRDFLGGSDRDTALVFAASGAGSMLAGVLFGAVRSFPRLSSPVAGQSPFLRLKGLRRSASEPVCLLLGKLCPGKNHPIFRINNLLRNRRYLWKNMMLLLLEPVPEA